MTKIDCFCKPDIKDYICVSKVTKEQLGTVVNNWLILNDGQLEAYPNINILYARKIKLDVIRYFTSSIEINNDKLICISRPNGNYRYYVKEN